MGPEEHYRTQLAAGQFELQRCDACRRHVFYPRLLCPHCGSSALSWVAASGEGCVHSTTVTRRRAESGGDFNVAIIELKEGPRLMSRVEGLAPDRVTIGLAVRARIARERDRVLLVFEPKDEADVR
jgi:uncharacterized OB-fold protein